MVEKPDGTERRFIKMASGLYCHDMAAEKFDLGGSRLKRKHDLTLSPWALMAGFMLDYNCHCCLEFGNTFRPMKSMITPCNPTRPGLSPYNQPGIIKVGTIS